MSSIVEICNRALAEIGTRSTITSLDEPSTEAMNCSLAYDSARKLLLRSAPWGCARTQKVLDLQSTLSNANLPYPFMYQYAYPSDCLLMRYIIALPQGFPSDEVVGDLLLPFLTPSRNNRFLVSTKSGSRSIITNVNQAIGVYTMDLTETEFFDPMFEEGLVATIASKIVIPLTGNVQLKQTLFQLAKLRVDEARAVDGNEAVPTTEHVPDFIAVRGVGAYGVGYNYGIGSAFGAWGSWYCGYSEGWGS